MRGFWIFILAPLISICFVTSVVGKNNLKKAHQVYYPFAFLLILIVAFLVVSLCTVGMIVQSGYGPWLVLSLLGIPLLWLLIHWSLWRITFCDDYWMFKKKKYSYEDITKIVFEKDERYTLFVGKKKFVISSLLVNEKAFTKMLKKKKVLKNAEVIRKK